jgi:outer membrane receptor for ferrienterochelin and colicins
MDMRVNAFVVLLMASLAFPSFGQEPKVHVVGAQTDTDARRGFIAGTIIIGRKRIEESGVRSVEDLLKREPAVTVRNGQISLLNLPGYTQILLDGQAPMAGRPLADLDLIHVEHIEIIKSSAAQYGPFGIAGTINIISRKIARKTSTMLSAGGQTGARELVSLSLSHDQSTTDSPMKYSFRLSARRDKVQRTSQLSRTIAREGADTQGQWLGFVDENTRTPILVLSGAVAWQTVRAGTVTVSPEFYRMGGGGVQTEFRERENNPALFVRDQTTGTNASFSWPLKWTFKPTGQSNLEFIARADANRFDTEGARLDTASAAGGDLRNSVVVLKKRTSKLELNYRLSTDSGHVIKLGASHFRAKTYEDYDHSLNGLDDAAMNALGTQRWLHSEQQRFYLQNEWQISEHLAAKIGTSVARNSIDAREQDQIVAAHSRMWSPSLHLSKKVGGDEGKQFRLSLARSYKAPSDQELIQRQEIHPLAPCASIEICLTNTIDTADTGGNLRLRPERALGLNLSYEHGIGQGSQFTLEMFTRKIKGKQGTQIRLEDVPWSSVRRYVSRPHNLGNARSNGLNFELELALRDLEKGAPDATVRGSLGLADSRISSLPGPDNRLDKQTPWTAKLGGSYKWNRAPIKFDLDANWSPGQWTRRNISERSYTPRSFEYDAAINWSLAKDTRLVVSLGANYPRDHQRINEYSVNEQSIRLSTKEKRSTRFKLQFDTKL